MKKIFAFALVLLSLLLGCRSENQEEAYVSKENTTHKSSIYSELENYNKKTFNISEERKGNGWRLGTGWAVTTADIMAVVPAFKICTGVAAFITALSGGTAGPATAVGVLVGTAFLAGGASYGTYRGICAGGVAMITDEYLNNLYENNETRPTIISFNERHTKDASIKNNCIVFTNDSIYEEIGQLHNLFVSNTISHTFKSTNPITYSTTPPTEDPGDLPPIVYEEVNSYGLTCFSDNDMVNMTSTINEKLEPFRNSYNYKETINTFIANQYLSENAAGILSLFIDALTQYSPDSEMIGSTINTYKSKVKETYELTKEEKDILIIAFSVAESTITYWSNFELFE
ncbi:hypothetical protein [Prevotella sp. KH2C16]|uniref:hypothetical protein n=1 Tax=Prevotella sp. KH2C16 TaxID=1855325 RepID=UPI0008F08EDB|nr:hypothetical protein [Prevotella sp. KH2C16]SFG41948.1 hypothetical protein SAMN05216383_11340 [Prevotella sp. KH2C16]